MANRVKIYSVRGMTFTCCKVHSVSSEFSFYDEHSHSKHLYREISDSLRKESEYRFDKDNVKFNDASGTHTEMITLSFATHIFNNDDLFESINATVIT